MWHPRSKLAGSVLCITALAIASSAFGQTIITPILVVNPGDSIQDQIDIAVEVSRRDNTRVTVWILKNPTGAYNEQISIPADADIRLLGVPSDRPWETIIDGGGAAPGTGAVIEIHTNHAAAGPPGPRDYIGPADVNNPFELSRLSIEGLTVRNGEYGIWIVGEGRDDLTDPPVQPTISRCIVLGSNPGAAQLQDQGIRVQHNAAPLIVNCSIGGYMNQQAGAGLFNQTFFNSMEGVHVETPRDPNPDFFTDILFSTVMMNENYGVYVENGASARVRNSIVYRNGDGLAPPPGQPEEGGLVWETDPFISPNTGVFDAAPGAAPPLGVRVTITGYGLFDPGDPAGTDVFFGPPDLGAETVWDTATAPGLATTDPGGGPQTMTAWLPPSYLGAPGPVDVHIVRADGLVHVARAGFTYVENTTSNQDNQPYVSQVVPEHGPVIPANVMDPSERRGNWAFVHGARFERECEVYWDTTPDRTLDRDDLPPPDDLRSERVIWLSSGLLYAKVPDPNPVPVGKIDVYVYNPASGLNSPDSATVPPDGPFREYEYLSPPPLPRPSITEISPNYYSDLGGRPGAVRSNTVDIIGWNFGPGMHQVGGEWEPMPVIVKIGGIVCPYREIIPEAAPPAPAQSADDSVNGIWQGPNDANGDSFDEIRDVIVPVAEFGTGGTYDVEVINFDGQSDIMPNAFTYYADSEPRLEPRTLGDTPIEWLPANFVERVGGSIAAQPRTFLGQHFDTGLYISYASGAVYSNDILGIVDLDQGVLPDEVQRQHQAHTQRLIEFAMPEDPAQSSGLETSPLFRTAFLPTVRDLVVAVDNVQNAHGVFYGATTPMGRVLTEFAWTESAPPGPGEAAFFRIDDVQMEDGLQNPDLFASMSVTGWSPQIEAAALVYVQDTEVDFALNGGTGRVELDIDRDDDGRPDTPSGQFGPADVTVIVPDSAAANNLGFDLYWVAEDAAWLPRLEPDGDYLPPDARAVVPRMTPETGRQVLQVLGGDFIGPFEEDANWNNATLWDYTRVSIWTDPGADWNNDGAPDPQVAVPLIPPDDFTTDAALLGYLNALVANGDIGAPTYPQAVTQYGVVSGTEIEFVLDDLTTHAVFSLGNRGFQRNTPLDIRVEHVDANGVVLADSAGNDLVYTLPGALVLMDTTTPGSEAPPPEITNVYRLDYLPWSGARWGRVLGGDIVAIEGYNFNLSGIAPGKPRVLFGGAEARVLDPGEIFTTWYGYSNPAAPALPVSLPVPPNAGPLDVVYVVTPQAPQGLPGTVDVTVLARWQDPAPGGPEWLLEGHAPEDLRFTYIMDAQPFVREIRPNFVGRAASNATGVENEGVYVTIHGKNLDDSVVVRFYRDDNGNGIPDNPAGGDGDEDDYIFSDTHFSVSPFEVVVKAPPADESAPVGVGLVDADFDTGAGTGTAGLVRLLVAVRNQWVAPTTEPERIISNYVPVFYHDDRIVRIQPLVAELEFNNAYINYRDYVNVEPGQGSLSVDPLLDPGPASIHTPGPAGPRFLPGMIVALPQDWWPGKLALRTGTDIPGVGSGVAFDNPMRDKAGRFPVLPYTLEDLELDDRPNIPGEPIHGTGQTGTPLSDVGADEISEGGFADLAWYFADLYPNPVPRLAPDQLSVEIRLNGLRRPLTATVDGDGNTIFPPPNQRVFIVPQGGEPWEPDHRIPLNFVEDAGVYREFGRSLYFLTNTEAIDTVVYRPLTGERDPDGNPIMGDVVADGHAAIFIYVPEECNWLGTDVLLGWYDPSSANYANPTIIMTDLSDVDLIISQAVTGRHFLIDTIPPRIEVENPLYLSNAITPWDIVTTTNDTTTTDAAFDLLYGLENHLPSMPPPMSMMGPIQYSPAVFAAPIEYGGVIVNRHTRTGLLAAPDEKAQIFVNTSSLANGLPAQDLAMDVAVQFVDPHVTEVLHGSNALVDNYAIAGLGNDGRTGLDALNFDRYTGSDTREVSGFLGSAFVDAVDVDVLTNPFVEAHWVFDSATAETVLGDSLDDTNGTTPADVDGTFTPAPATDEPPDLLGYTPGYIRDNWGFLRYAPGTLAAAAADPVEFPALNALEAVWNLAGLDWEDARDSVFHLPVRFRARDRAGNIAETTVLLDPLHIRWSLSLQTKFDLSPGEGAVTNQPRFRWSLLRSDDANPQTFLGPQPGFIYRIYVTIPPNNIYDGRYTPVVPWSPWDATQNTLGPDDFRQAMVNWGLDPEGDEYWILVVVLAADEFGNVEPWYYRIPDIPPGNPEAGVRLFEGSDSDVDFREPFVGPVLADRRKRWAVQLENWQRFLWSGIAKPDTKVTPVFWYGDVDNPPTLADGDQRLGSNPYVVLPPRGPQKVEAVFNLEALYSGRLDPGESLQVQWELYEEGTLLDSGYADPTDGDENPVVIPLDLSGYVYDPNDDHPTDLGDHQRLRPVHYVFSAATYIETDSPSDGHTVGERIDPTWASVPFVVTPFPVDPKTDADKQPIKITEDQ